MLASTSFGFILDSMADFDLEEARKRLGNRLETDVSVHAARISLD